jgi:hypothetical protein
MLSPNEVYNSKSLEETKDLLLIQEKFDYKLGELMLTQNIEGFDGIYHFGRRTIKQNEKNCF